MQEVNTPVGVLSKIIFGGWWNSWYKYQEKTVCFIYKNTAYLLRYSLNSSTGQTCQD